jgi:NDP-sugar pyrophosphorylase family protein
MDVIILCGGESKRMKPDFPGPKGLVKVDHRSILDWQIDWLQECCVDNIILSTRWKDMTYHDDVIYAIEDRPMGTAGGVYNALFYVKSNNVYVMNVDDILLYHDPYFVEERMNVHLESSAFMVTASQYQLPFGVIIEDPNGKIISLKEKPYVNYTVSTGHYLYRTYMLKNYIVNEGSLEHDVNPLMVEMEHVRTYKIMDKWITVNNYKQLLEARKVLQTYTSSR